MTLTTTVRRKHVVICVPSDVQRKGSRAETPTVSILQRNRLFRSLVIGQGGLSGKDQSVSLLQQVV